MALQGAGSSGDQESRRARAADVMPAESGATAAVVSSRATKNDAKAIEQATKALITSQIRAPFYDVHEDILMLLKQCLLADQRGFCTSALSGHVDHFESLHDDDFGWGCGWRNIQIMCSFLLSQDCEAKDALFHGAGFVPDIPALQRWLEIAWMKGFDTSGAEYFNWQISGTKKWIGTTECAALLRSFGVRAMIVSFTGLSGEQPEPSCGGLSVSGGGGGGDGKEPDKVLKRPLRKSNSADLPDDETQTVDPTLTELQRSSIDCQECGESSPHGTSRKSVLDEDYDLCCNCMEKARIADDDDGAPSDGATTKKREQEKQEKQEKKSECQKDSVVVSACAAEPEEKEEGEESEIDSTMNEIRDSFNDDVHWGIKCSGCETKPIRGARYRSLVNKECDYCGECLKGILAKANGENGTHENFITVQKIPASRLPDDSPPRGGKDVQNRKKAGTGENENSWQLADKSINHYHLIEWVWSYFSGESSYRSTPDSPYPRQPVVMSNRSPLYFQHRGHSRTIVGIEHRQLSDNSEEINLLILDPSQSSEYLAKTLREKRGWKKLIGHDVHTLKQSEYQLCYAERGIAQGEELENLKVLNSLNYSTYTTRRKKRK
ncbi:zinc finger-containing ubiquitin peptidase 1 [Marchantia polymorpha subsp. ruderalis]